MSLELRKLNNYRFTDQDINDIIAYRQNPIPANIPAALNNRQRNRFAAKFNADWVVQNRPAPIGLTLFYHPNPNLNLRVIRPGQKRAILAHVFQSILYTGGRVRTRSILQCSYKPLSKYKTERGRGVFKETG